MSISHSPNWLLPTPNGFVEHSTTGYLSSLRDMTRPGRRQHQATMPQQHFSKESKAKTNKASQLHYTTEKDCSLRITPFYSQLVQKMEEK